MASLGVCPAMRKVTNRSSTRNESIRQNKDDTDGLREILVQRLYDRVTVETYAAA
jgi:hypothetical protein